VYVFAGNGDIYQLGGWIAGFSIKLVLFLTCGPLVLDANARLCPILGSSHYARHWPRHIQRFIHHLPPNWLINFVLGLSRGNYFNQKVADYVTHNLNSFLSLAVLGEALVSLMLNGIL